MMRIKYSVFNWILLFVLLPGSHLLAQPFDCSSANLNETTPDGAQRVLDRLKENDCFADNLCETTFLGENALCEDIETFRNKVDQGKLKREDLVDEVGTLILRVAASLKQVSALSDEMQGAQQDFLTEMAKQIERRTYETSEPHAARWAIDLQRMFDDEDNATEVTPISTVRAQCADVNNDCPAALQSMAQFLAHAAAMHRILLKLGDPYRQETLQYLGVVNARWKAFRESGRALYPWEIWLNDRSYRIRPFGGPPDRQWIFLHPGPGYEFSDEYEDEQFFETAVLEVVGFYRWGWKDDGDLKRPWGASLVATWRDHPMDEPLGAGLLIHTPVENMSLGTTWRDGPNGDEWSVLVNVDLAKWILGDGKLQGAVRKQFFGLE